MVQFGPNSGKTQFYCARVIIALTFITALAFASSLLALYFLNKGYKLAILDNSPFVHSQDDVLIQTSLGHIQGFSQHVFNIKVNTFLGIPYAQPPVLERRFEKPVMVQPWTHVFKAHSYAPHCPQNFDQKYLEIIKPIHRNMSEDCLYLNIWSPIRGSNSNQLKAVMVWFHGGGFSEGSANLRMSEGSILAALGDVVVITFNYRLGFFGFVDTGIGQTANQGLYDQKLALEWIKEHISNFGGDPNSITLFGQSAGAICIGIHMISSLTKNLFHRAILQSGSPIIFNSFYNDNANSIHSLAELTTCNQTLALPSYNKSVNIIDQQVLNCLKQISTKEIINASQSVLKHSKYAFKPIPFDDFMPTLPSEIIYDQTMNDEYSSIKEILLGGNEDEFAFYLHLTLPAIFSRESVNINITNLEELKLLFVNFTKNFGIEEKTANNMASYFFHDDPVKDTTENYVKRFYTVFGDLMFTCPSLILAQELAKIKKTVYFYWFTYRPENQLWGSWAGTPHMSEIPYIFGTPLIYPNIFTKNDTDMSKKMIKTWSHFAKHG